MVTSIENDQRSLVMTQAVALYGVYPSRDGYGEVPMAMVRSFAGNFAPGGSAEGQGQLLSIASNTALFSLVGTMYGGNGITTFALPDLNGRSIVGSGFGPGLSVRTVGETFGSGSVTLTTANMPAAAGGTGAAFDNYGPTTAMTYAIRTDGNYPSGGGFIDMIGVVQAFSGNFAPGGYMEAAGQLLSIQEYTALFSVIGTTYGGDGMTTFALPDLRGRTIEGVGNDVDLGESFGTEAGFITTANLPTGAGGTGEAIDNESPTLGLNYLIATNGIYPSYSGSSSFDSFTSTLGEVVAFAGNILPSGWALANGQLLAINQNQALFSLLGTQYGGDGITTFALPDLRGRTIVGSGSNVGPVGTAYGTSTISLTSSDVPNVDPTFAAFDAAIPSATEQVAVTIDNNATVADFNLDHLAGGVGNYSGAKLIFQRSGGADANDSFGVTGTLAINGANLELGGTVVASFTNVGGVFTITFAANVTSAQADAVLQQITYTYADDAPPATVTLAVTFDDGNTGTQGSEPPNGTVTHNVTVTITDINDAPTVSATGVNPTFTEGGAAADLFSGVVASAVEVGQTFTAMTVTVTNVTDGADEVLVFDGSDVTLTDGNSVTTLGNGLSVTVSLVGSTATVSFSGVALSAAQLQALIDGMGYSNLSLTPDTATRDVTITSLTDSGGTALGGVETSALSLTSSVTVAAVDSPAVAQDDALTTDEATPVAALDLFANNGSGVDFDPESNAFLVTEVDYNAAGVGVPVTLASGALVTMTAGGSLSYDPNGAYDSLPGAASGASNLSAGDSFDYTVTGGDSATVFITVTGIDSDDVLMGTAAADTMYGGIGDDTIYGDAGADALDGGTGTGDWVDYETSLGGVTIALDGSAGVGGDADGDTLVNVENLEGSALADDLTGSAGDNILHGEGGDDTINGLAGRDVIAGGAGADSMDGGDDRDTADYRASLLAVTVSLATGAGTAGDAAGDTLVNIEGIHGSEQGDDLTGDALRNVLAGLGGDDTLDGGDGDDLIGGGVGADSLIGGLGSDTLNYVNSIAGVTVDLATGSASGGDAAGDSFSGFENIFGSAQDDALTGDATRNILIGFGGNDTILGGDGGDRIRGSAGADSMDGGADSDMLDYRGSSAAVVIDLSTNSASGGEATGDSIANFEYVYGSVHDDVLTGDAGRNVLNGFDGNDTIVAGADRDLVRGGAGADSMDGGGDVDTLDYRDSSGAITIDLSTNSASGGDATGDSIINFESVYATSSGDHLTGNANANVLFGFGGVDAILGGDGRDLISGGDGGDSLDGGAYIDTLSYKTSTGGVRINLATGTASGGDATGDTIANFENAYGSQHGDSLTGDDGRNVLVGLDGDDTLLGGLDNDFIRGGTGADSMDGGDGIDTLDYRDSVGPINLDVGANTASGGDATGDTIANFENAYGSAFADVLTGGLGRNSLHGAEGDDTIDGGVGNDRLYGGLDADTFVFNAGSDLIDGGDGTDWAEFTGNFTGFTVTNLGGGNWTVLHIATGDLDTLTSIESLAFNDMII